MAFSTANCDLLKFLTLSASHVDWNLIFFETEKNSPKLRWVGSRRLGWFVFFRDKALEESLIFSDDWWWLGKMVSPKIAQVWTSTANGMRDWRWFDLGLLHILRGRLGDCRYAHIFPVVPHVNWGPTSHHLGCATEEPWGFLWTQQPYTWWLWGLLWPPRGLLMQRLRLVSASQRTGVMKWLITYYESWVFPGKAFPAQYWGPTLGN